MLTINYRRTRLEAGDLLEGDCNIQVRDVTSLCGAGGVTVSRYHLKEKPAGFPYSWYGVRKNKEIQGFEPTDKRWSS